MRAVESENENLSYVEGIGISDSSLFRVSMLRSKVVYPNLAKHNFTSDEKIEFLDLASEAVDESIVKNISAFSDLYKISARTINDWKNRRIRDELLHSQAGRPTVLDAQVVEDLLAEIRSLRRSKNAPNETHLFKLFQQFADETSLRANKPKRDLSLRTCQYLITKLGLKKRTPRYMTEVRVKSASDLRMTYSMILMIKACLEGKLEPLVWNWDGTQFVVRMTAAGARVYILDDDEDPTPVTAIGDSGLDYAIKWMFLGSAAGDAAPLVFIIAAPDLPPDKWQVYEIKGMSVTTDSGKTHYLCIGHDRQGTAHLYQWFMRSIVIATIVKTRSDNDLRDENGMFSEAHVNADGESAILNEALTNDVVSDLQDHEITLGKIAASCSHIHQAADVGPVFRALKAHLAAITCKGVSVENSLLDLRIKEQLAKIEEEFSITLGEDRKDRLSFGLRTLVKVMKDMLTADLIKKGFEKNWSVPSRLRQVYWSMLHYFG
jgi:hypothetical protein